MARLAALGTLVLVLLAAPAAVMAQPSTPSLDEGGIVERVDRTGNVVVLKGGRMYRVTPTTVVYVDGQPVAFSALQPGQTVIVRSGEPVIYRGGQYVVVSPGTAVGSHTTVTTPGGAVTTTPGGTITTSPGGAITTAPGSTVVVTQPPATSIRRTIHGTVIDVDPGEIKVTTEGGDFEVQIPPEMTSQIRKGDNVQLDMTVTPSSPAASPRLR